ncbi:hypothetical protein WDU94_007481 [Cyamophila willieti]
MHLVIDIIVTLPKKSKSKLSGKEKSNNAKLLVDPSVKFSVADIIAYCRGPNIRPENIDLDEEYKNFKKSKNSQFSALLGSVPKKSCEPKAPSDNLGDKDNEESVCPQVNISNIKEEVIDGVSGTKDTNLREDICSNCVKIQSRTKETRLWFKSVSGVEYFCKVCLGSYPSIGQLKVHLDSHGTSQYKCQQCTMGFSCKACLSKHVDKNHESDMYTCHNCSKEFSNKTKLMAHMKILHNGKKYTCAHCLKSFPYRSTLLYHLKKYHEGIQFQCAHCSKLCYTKQCMSKHIFSHHKAYSSVRIQCHLCTNNFTKESTLENHIRKRHKRVPCEECGQTFSTTGNMTKHMDAQHKGKRYNCSYCSKQFPYSQYLKNHVRVKHKGVEFKCKLCDKQLSSNSNLSRHLRNMHCESIPIPEALEELIFEK